LNEYERITRETRRRVSRLTLQQQRDILRIYDGAIKSISEQVKKAGNKTLSQRWLTDYRRELTRTRAALARELDKSITGYTTRAAREAVNGQLMIINGIMEAARLDPGNHFSTALSVVQRDVVNDIVSGGLYKDNKALSRRIWIHAGDNTRDIESIIAQGIAEKKSAIKLAEDLEEYVKPSAERPSNWGAAYPTLAGKAVDYNAQRLARTSINHAYQSATIRACQDNPFVEGIEWRSALIHGRTCQTCIDRHGVIFPKDDVPLDHPSGMCTVLPVITKSSDSIANELNDWVNGGNNRGLDDWFDGYTPNIL